MDTKTLTNRITTNIFFCNRSRIAQDMSIAVTIITETNSACGRNFLKFLNRPKKSSNKTKAMKESPIKNAAK